MPSTALILAGHGSHISANTAGLVWDAVDALRRMSVADEITAAFWKEMPSFATVFDSIVSDDITIVPLFTAQGYFTRTVLPTEMGLGEPLSSPGPQLERFARGEPARRPSSSQRAPIVMEIGGKQRVVRYARTLGEHPAVTQIVRDRVDMAIGAAGVTPDQVAIAVIGHSTRRNPESRKATEAQVMLLRGAIPAREVVAVYLDDTPGISDIYSLTTAPYIIAVPYFLAAGSHTTQDVPEALGIPALTPHPDADPRKTDEIPALRAGQVQGRTVIYTQPLGTKVEISRMAVDLARAAGAPLHTMYPGSAWNGFPAAGFDDTRRLLASAPAQFGQLWITQAEIRHIEDRRLDDLTRIESPSVLRRVVRENPLRPLATSGDLPRGWYVMINGDAQRLHAAIETIYPGVPGISQQARKFGVDPLAWQAVIARQTGQYRALHDISPSEHTRVMEKICSHCVQVPLWAGESPADKGLLCREPCNVWLSEAVRTGEDAE
jgi:sirohydrochlorin cobaltochelatase